MPKPWDGCSGGSSLLGMGRGVVVRVVLVSILLVTLGDEVAFSQVSYYGGLFTDVLFPGWWGGSYYYVTGWFFYGGYIIIKNIMDSPYYTDLAVRSSIDSLLRMNACIQANLGTRSAHDIGTREASEQLWHQWLLEIKGLDPEFYSTISTAEEKEMVTKKIYSKRIFRALQRRDV